MPEEQEDQQVKGEKEHQQKQEKKEEDQQEKEEADSSKEWSMLGEGRDSTESGVSCREASDWTIL